MNLTGMRPMMVGEVVQAGDRMIYASTVAVITVCKYGYGCCVGHVVEPQDNYWTDRLFIKAEALKT